VVKAYIVYTQRKGKEAMKKYVLFVSLVSVLSIGSTGAMEFTYDDEKSEISEALMNSNSRDYSEEMTEGELLEMSPQRYQQQQQEKTVSSCCQEDSGKQPGNCGVSKDVAEKYILEFKLATYYDSQEEKGSLSDDLWFIANAGFPADKEMEWCSIL